jgi:ankyrin repeat protein
MMDKAIKLGRKLSHKMLKNPRCSLSQIATRVTPITLAAAMGHVKCLEVLLQNPQANIDAVEEYTGANAFWFAAYFGRGQAMRTLAEAGANVLDCHKSTEENALHVAVQHKDYTILDLLVASEFPLDLPRKGGVTALMIGARYTGHIDICERLIEGGADINIISEAGDSALGEAIRYENIELAKLLMRLGASPFYEDSDLKIMSPFYSAIRHKKRWAVELICDNEDVLWMFTNNHRFAMVYAA